MKTAPLAQVAAGLLGANAIEWLVHKHVLHGLGRKRSSFWAFHWHEHHKNSRRNGHLDGDYLDSVFQWNGQGKEAAALVAAGAALAPLAPKLPWLVGAMWASGFTYYFVHKRAHVDPDWARENLPWHYDHHMGPDQDANWCVTHPMMDHLLGTRKPYVGTEREERDRAKREAKTAARSE